MITTRPLAYYKNDPGLNPKRLHVSIYLRVHTASQHHRHLHRRENIKSHKLGNVSEV
jgi:predicted transcriptional regulator